MTTTATINPELEELATLKRQEAELQSRIAAVQIRIREAERAKFIAQLAEVRNQLRESRAIIERDKPIWYQQQLDQQNTQARIKRNDEAISDSLRVRPPAVDYVPADPECVSWQRQHDALIVQRDQHRIEYRELADPEVLRLQLVEAQNRVSQLTFSEVNLIRAIEGKSAKAWVA